MELNFDVNQLTVGDLEDIEEIVGSAYEKLNFEKPSGKLMKALVFIIGRRDNPDFTLEDARNVKITEIKTPDEAKPDPPTETGDAS